MSNDTNKIINLKQTKDIIERINNEVTEKINNVTPSIDSVLSESSTNAVQNKTITQELNKKVTQTDVDNTISNKILELINSAPGTLDTLGELASALGEDPNFATTIATQLGEKATKEELNTKLNISDLPNALPADGGNADTVGGKSINDIQTRNFGYDFYNRDIDWNDIKTSGYYGLINQTSSSKHCPIDGKFFYLMVFKYANDALTQIAIPYNCTDGATEARYTYIRSCNSGTWNNWRHIGNGATLPDSGVTAGTYEFFTGLAWVASNRGVADSTATLTLTLKSLHSVSFDYMSGSESNYDKFTIKVDSTTYGPYSGANQSGTYSSGSNLSANTQIVLTYTKDGSADSNGDYACITNLKVGSNIITPANIENFFTVTNGSSYTFKPVEINHNNKLTVDTKGRVTNVNTATTPVIRTYNQSGYDLIIFPSATIDYNQDDPTHYIFNSSTITSRAGSKHNILFKKGIYNFNGSINDESMFEYCDVSFDFEPGVILNISPSSISSGYEVFRLGNKVVFNKSQNFVTINANNNNANNLFYIWGEHTIIQNIIINYNVNGANTTFIYIDMANYNIIQNVFIKRSNGSCGDNIKFNGGNYNIINNFNDTTQLYDIDIQNSGSYNKIIGCRCKEIIMGDNTKFNIATGCILKNGTSISGNGNICNSNSNIMYS